MGGERVIKWFSKKDEFIVGSEEIRKFDLKKFIKIFDHTAKDDPYMEGGCYKIEQEHLKAIQPHIKHRIVLEKYNYYFGTYESEED